MSDNTIHAKATWAFRPPDIKRFVRQALGFLAQGIKDMNRYLDAASRVHPAGQPGPETSRDHSRKWPV